MAHSIHAFVCRPGLFHRLRMNCPAAAAPLAQNMRLVAMTHELWKVMYAHFHAGPAPDRAQIRLSNWRKPERAFLERLSTGGTVAFIETNYFGGEGNQGAIVAKSGKIVFGPDVARSGVVNRALRLLGVSRGKDEFDEFDSLGLGEFRDNADIIRAFLRSNWIRAWFVIPESNLPELERKAKNQPNFPVHREASGLYSCPVEPPADSPVVEYLMEKSTMMHDFDIAKEALWWMNDFFKNRRGIALTPRRHHPLARRLQHKTGVAFTVWNEIQARSLAEMLKSVENEEHEFAHFRSDVYHTCPPQHTIRRFQAATEFLRHFFGKIRSGLVGVLVQP